MKSKLLENIVIYMALQMCAVSSETTIQKKTEIT